MLAFWGKTRGIPGRLELKVVSGTEARGAGHMKGFLLHVPTLAVGEHRGFQTPSFRGQ